MTLAAGTKLGPYEVVAPLGAGGMGEVYRARDTRLGRDVAVKVLPQHLSANPEVRARFEREARTVSGLNHPNICTLFDVGREGETDYLVMELVEGETLSERLRRGALPLPDVLRWGGQVADALDRAHRAGVVHRDLKPGNIMITKNGAKLMDFGLARASATAGPMSGSGATMAALTQHPTVTSPLTAEGAIVGTFQYMAPEQLEGREADARADLWALGCVLYEMVTGRRAFEGRSQASLITAIMGSQPEPLASLAPLSPPALERLVNALLAKDADDRIQTAHDVKLQLGWMSEPGSAASAAGAAPVTAVREAGAPVWLAPALAVVALAAGVLVGAKLLRPHERPLTTQVPLPNGTRMPLFTSVATISPDGRHVVVAADGDAESASSRLLLLPLERYAPTVLVPATAIMMPCWSPDSRSVAYFDNRAKEVSTLAITGGSPTKLCAFSDPRGVTWGRKGTLVFAPTPTGPLLRVSQAGGAPQPATVLDSTRGEASHRFPCFLPDGEHFLFVALPAGPEGFPIKLGSLHSMESREVMRAESGVTVTPSGKIVYVRRGKVVAQAFDMRAMRPRGEPVAIADASPRSDMDGEPPASASADGKMLLARLPKPLASMEWLDRKGTLLSSVPVGESNWIVHSLSPDQRTALATSEGALWQVDLERGVPTRLLPSVDPVECAVFSPDGKRILATDKSGDREDLVILPFGGGTTVSTGLKTALFQEPRDWAPDGSLLIAALGGPPGERTTSGSWDFWRVPPGDAAPERYASSPDFERYASLSPDGRWVAWTRRAEGQFDMLVDSWPASGQRLQLFAGTTLGWELVYWGLGGRELLYLDAKNRMMSVPLTFGPDGPRAGTPVRLFEMPAGTFSFTTRDGARFLVSRDAHPGNLPTLLLIQHWEALLQP